MKKSDFYYLNEQGLLTFTEFTTEKGGIEIVVFEKIQLLDTPQNLLMQSSLEIEHSVIKEAVFLFHEPEKGIGETSFFLSFETITPPSQIISIAKSVLASGKEVTASSSRCYDKDGRHNYDYTSCAFVRLNIEEETLMNQLKVA